MRLGYGVLGADGPDGPQPYMCSFGTWRNLDEILRAPATFQLQPVMGAKLNWSEERGRRWIKFEGPRGVISISSNGVHYRQLYFNEIK